MEQTADPLARPRAAAATRRAAGLRRTLRARTPDDDGLPDPASDDHLGPAGDERPAEAAVAAVRTWGTGSTGSRPVTGSTTLYARLERRLSAFTGAAGALVCSSGRLADLAATARGLGLGLGLKTTEPVVPVVPGRPEAALRAARVCAEHGVRAGCLRPPSVPEDRSCLRSTARANLSSDDLAVIRGALTAVAEMKVTM
ncbi:hypothetical protein ACIBCT_08025 [Streptosporangium sp. NPDC050855]|uniref:hypothetical protein n=1 Tax=Streptosporangium sp. NPDC050855 TaxID=3366194 RepID=UPI003795AB72